MLHRKELLIKLLGLGLNHTIETVFVKQRPFDVRGVQKFDL